MPLDDLENLNEWGMTIWFELHPSRLLSISMGKHGKVKLFDDCTFSTVDGAVLPDFAVPACDETCTDFPKKTHLSEWVQ